MEKIRVYFDYNIYVLIQQGKFIYEKCNDIDIFYSVSHVEEYYKAIMSDTDLKHQEENEEMKDIIVNLSKNVILNPSKKRIIAINESFDDCLKRCENDDTRNIVNKNGEKLYSINKKAVDELHDKDKSTKNNTNISKELIWEREEVKNELNGFDVYLKNYLLNYRKTLMSQYGKRAYTKELDICVPTGFKLVQGCFKNGYDSFSLLELVIEFLNNILCKCGYNKDEDKRKTQSGIHDCSHIIYSTYCDYFISRDSRLTNRANAIFFYLGLDTKAINLEEFINMLERKK